MKTCADAERHAKVLKSSSMILLYISCVFSLWTNPVGEMPINVVKFL